MAPETLRIRSIVAAPLLGDSPKGGWSAEIRPDDSVHALMMIRAYRMRGHLAADLDPLHMRKTGLEAELDPATYGFTEARTASGAGRRSCVTAAVASRPQSTATTKVSIRATGPRR